MGGCHGETQTSIVLMWLSNIRCVHIASSRLPEVCCAFSCGPKRAWQKIDDPFRNVLAIVTRMKSTLPQVPCDVCSHWV